MFKIGDYLVYEKNVCRVIEIKEKHYNDTDYYVLTQVDDLSLKRELPINNTKIRPLLDKKQVVKLIDEIVDIPVVELLKDNHKIIETAYRKLNDSGNHEDLIKILKTSYLRIKERKDMDKQGSSIDETYYKLTETYLCTEFSIVLGISFNEAKNLIVEKIKSI